MKIEQKLVSSRHENSYSALLSTSLGRLQHRWQFWAMPESITSHFSGRKTAGCDINQKHLKSPAFSTSSAMVSRGLHWLARACSSNLATNSKSNYWDTFELISVHDVGLLMVFENIALASQNETTNSSSTGECFRFRKGLPDVTLNWPVPRGRNVFRHSDSDFAGTGNPR